MRILNFSHHTFLGEPPSAKRSKSELLAGSNVFVFRNADDFKEFVGSLGDRISGVAVFEVLPDRLPIQNDCLLLLAQAFFQGDEHQIRQGLEAIIETIEKKRELVSQNHVFNQEKDKLKSSLDLVTKNYYQTVKTLERQSQIQSRRKDAILALTNKAAGISGFQIDLHTKAVTYSENFDQNLPGTCAFKFDFEKGFSCLSDAANSIILNDLLKCMKYGLHTYSEFCADESRMEFLAIQFERYDEEVPRILGVLQNISLRKRMEREREIDRQKAVISSKLAALGEMSGGIAHEINTPLSTLSLQITRFERVLQKRDQFDHMLCGYTTEMKSTVDRIAKIVRGLKVLSRQDEKPELTPTSLEKLLSDLYSLLSVRLNNHNISYEIIDPHRLANRICLLAEVHLSQILVNLINNAIDAVEELDKKWIKILIERPGESFIQVSVVDSGTGIPKSVQENIFNPFFTTKEVGKGTGLGLTLSKNLARNFGGDLNLNQLSEHTRFDLIIPFTEVREDENTFTG